MSVSRINPPAARTVTLELFPRGTEDLRGAVLVVTDDGLENGGERRRLLLLGDDYRMAQDLLGTGGPGIVVEVRFRRVG